MLDPFIFLQVAGATNKTISRSSLQLEVQMSCLKEGCRFASLCKNKKVSTSITFVFLWSDIDKGMIVKLGTNVKEFICFFIQHNLEPFTVPSLAINFFLKNNKANKNSNTP